MTLRAYLRVLRERWRLLAVFILVTTAVAIAVTALTPKSYSASAQVLVSSSSNADASIQNQSNAYVVTQVPTYAKVIGSTDVLRYVQNDLHLGLTDRQLRDKLTASAATGESIVTVTATDGSAARAETIANSAARGFIRAIESYSGSVKLFLTGPADQPSSPSSPTPVLNITLGLLLGLLLGAATAVVRDVLDNRIKDVETLAKVSQAPVMGIIVDDSQAGRHPIASRAGARNIRAENFRQLRANLQFANVDAHPRVLAVTSALPAEGKTTVALNLASTLAEAGFSVCLVDADLRRPSVASALGLPRPVGLTNVLIQQVELDDVLQQAGSRLFVLASGPTPPNPSEVLASSYVRDVVRSLLDRVDYVVLDTAPLLPVADGSEVAALADGTLLVARHASTTDTNVTRAIQSLQRVDAVLIGTVLNRMPPSRGNRDYGYQYYRNPGQSGSLSKPGGPASTAPARELPTAAAPVPTDLRGSSL